MVDNDSDISTDSEEEFLTVGDDGKGNLDREALVRKKLLESFYGKSAVAAAAPVAGGVDTDDEDGDDEETSVQRLNGKSGTRVEDLDSPFFDAAGHTENLLFGASVQTLLEKEEQLALQVRTLDSTMQTLVYENYSRFIDATDAIKSIGVNVQVNEQGLMSLTEGMQAIDAKSRAVEEALGSLRDQVAEKIRVKRLLTRLDTLLKLPRTLKEQISAGKYRAATKSFFATASILSKHSEGFESLKTIESECQNLLAEMKTNIRNKLLHWSGRKTSFDDFDVADNNDIVLDPPKAMSDIFECVDTLLMFSKIGDSSYETDDESLLDDIQSMTTLAALRLLDRSLDIHLIEVQERRFANPSLESAEIDMGIGGIVSRQNTDMNTSGSSLIAVDVLNAMLEGANMFSSSFKTVESRNTHLIEFISEGFTSFLAHTKSVLIDESPPHGPEDIGHHDEAGEEGTTCYKEIAGALAILLQSVKVLASGLNLPEIGLSGEFTLNLVQQATSLTESMVRRRVDQKFRSLRLSVVEDCLIPFTTRAADEKHRGVNEEKDCVASVIQLANSTISDCLQLVDDTIRSILAGGLWIGDSGSTAWDMPDLRDALLASTTKFAFWMANTFEYLAGGELAGPSQIIDAPPISTMEKISEEGFEKSISFSSCIQGDDDPGDLVGQDSLFSAKIDEAKKLIVVSEGENDCSVQTVFVLAIAEMCKMAEGSVSKNIERSIATHLGGGKKKSRALFPPNESCLTKQSQDDDDITKRFRLARSTILMLYASARGAEAANILCSGLGRLAHMSSADAPDSPSESPSKALLVAKNTSIEFAAAFGGSRRARPVKEFDDSRLLNVGSSLTNRKSGLSLDVERIFKEKVPIYPHTHELLEATRNAVLFLVFKIAFRAMLEHARLLIFTPQAFLQLVVDTTFLKQMLSHYIDSDFSPHGSSALTALANILEDFMDMVMSRCANGNVMDMKVDASDQAIADVRVFLTSFEASKIFVLEDD